ncbi:hypothetical protein F5Y19DRAFT_474601 [Xylariaceae sp. FL1651]|nr:hypothetical protein F5Y19DRAFT_474601 [Xylariaceae sp. FL1651]
MSSDNCTSQDSAFHGSTIREVLEEAFRKKDLQEALRERCRGKNSQEVLEEVVMAVPMLLALTICPALLGTQEAIRQSQSKNKREEHRARRCNLAVSCVKQSIRSRDINGKLVVLKDNKLWINTTPPASHDEYPETIDSGYPFSGYFLPYPDTQYEGLVSTISDEPPMLNWIYVDKNTYEVKYGVRADAQEHITGPFDCTRQDRRMTLEGWEGFVAVEEFPGVWALYFDRDDDGLVTKIPMGTRVLEVELTRREKKERKPEPDPNQAQTLDQMMKTHKEQSQKQEEEANGFLRDEKQGQKHEQTPSLHHEPAANGTQELSPGGAEISSARLGMNKLQLKTNAAANIQSEPHAAATAVSPSITTDSLSFWSAEKATAVTGETASVTEASFIETNRGVNGVAEDSEQSKYRKPYVEDGPGDELAGDT